MGDTGSPFEDEILAEYKVFECCLFFWVDHGLFVRSFVLGPISRPLGKHHSCPAIAANAL
jgi:hypothetical protein